MHHADAVARDLCPGRGDRLVLDLTPRRRVEKRAGGRVARRRVTVWTGVLAGRRRLLGSWTPPLWVHVL
jgi:hypothetical protein